MSNNSVTMSHAASKRRSLKRHPMRSFDVVATDAQVALVGFRSGGTDKKDGSSGGGGGGGGPSRIPASQQAGGVSGGAIQTISTGTFAGESRGEMTTRWYVDSPQFTGNPPLSEKAELSSLPVITPMGLQQTMLAALGQSDPLAFGMDTASRTTSPEKKLAKTQPKGTFEYKVKKNDTLERIAAHFDVTPSELKKLNRMSSRMVFENQMLYIPDPDYVPSDPPTPEHISPPQSPVDARPKIDIPIVKMADKPPARVPGHVMKIPSPPSSAPPQKTPAPCLPRALSEDEAKKLDEECYERFIKVCAQYISEGFEKVAGTLLVTPNAIMFDPDVLDERVIEKGSDKFGVVVYMDTVQSAALYHDLSAMRYHTRSSSQKETSQKPEIYHGDSRGRSASASDILTSKLLVADQEDTTQSFAASKSAPGLSPYDKVGEDSRDVLDSKTSLSGLSPFFTSAGESTTDTDSLEIVSLSEDGSSSAIRIVGDKQHFGDGSTVEIAGVAGETSTDDAVSSLVTFDLDSLTNRQNVDSSRVSISQEEVTGDERDSDLVEQSAEGRERKEGDRETGKNKETETPKLHDEMDIAALLAGGRTDSMSASGVGKDGGTSPFCPTVTKTISSDKSVTRVEDAGVQMEKPGEVQSSDALVQQCADKLVAEILESVSLSAVQKGGDALLSDAPADMPCSATKGLVQESPEESKEKSCQGTTNMQAREKSGDEMRIGNIVYLPVDENSDGEMTVRNATNVFKGDDVSDNSNVAKTSDKPRPPPLSELGPDVADGSSATAADSSRPRPASDSFSPLLSSAQHLSSPLRSSAQHLSNFVNYATGFFRSSTDDRANVKDIHDIPIVRDKSSVSSETDGAKKKAESEAGKQPGSRAEYRAKNAVKVEERPELFRQVSDLIPPQEDVHKQPAIYLHMRVDEVECDRRVTTSAPYESCRHQVTKPHYWFSVPRNKADHLYAFFVQWRPDLYGEDDINPEDRGFVVVDAVDVEEQAGTLPFVDDYFGQLGSAFRKDWEIISREEARRRESLAIDQSTMPELSQDSSIMNQQHIIQLSDSLPPRTIGYKWSLVYSTGLHGFSLKRLYREVGHIDSPILLVLQDTENTVFGAFLSDPPKLSDHFFGTGMCQLWTFKDKFRSFNWSGDNAFFIKGDDNSMSVGASQGLYGLWLDSDLYHGRSQQCNTFNNIVLSAHEDFCISALEAWAFISD